MATPSQYTEFDWTCQSCGGPKSSSRDEQDTEHPVEHEMRECIEHLAERIKQLEAQGSSENGIFHV